MSLRTSMITLMTASTLLLGCSRTSGETRETASEPDAAFESASAIELALATTADETQRTALVERLRRDGPAGLDRLIAEYERVPERSAAEDQAWRALIDQVAQQRDARYGGLFWHRDMNLARAEADATGKPILSLRLLGDLTSEYSCANSRLFRTLLYADPELAAWLEGNFVLHWSSERPAPKLEIDFGDGRKLARTITGNSAHFVLDARGRTLDVIPGLLAGESFRAALADSLVLHAALERVDDDASWHGVVAEHHEQRFASRVTELADALAWLRGAAQDRVALQAWLGRSSNPDGASVPAAAAVPIAIGKMRIEAPILAAAPGQLGGSARAPERLAPTDDELERIGQRLAPSLALHPNSEAILASERPLDGLVPADQRPAAEVALREALLRSIHADTGRNQLEMHARVHLELAARARAARSLGFADVDEWIYAELFETPASDPWLGLVSPEVYTGLMAGGVIGERPAP